MGIDIKYGIGQTSIEEEEKDDLIPLWVLNTAHLNLAEQENINKAALFFERKKINPEEILSFSFLMRLHKKMFEDVWSWAGSLRRTNKNIGVCKTQIRTSTHETLEDAKYWITYNTFQPDEIALRCKHRIVSIHLFPNGNGRHSRLLADLLIKSLGGDSFTWGTSLTEARKKYLESLRKADLGNYSSLVQFARQ